MNTPSNEYLMQGMQAFANNDFEESIELFTHHLQDDPDDKTALLSRGSAQLKLDRLDAAAADFTRVIKISPDHVRALHLRGLVRERQGKDDQALADFNRAIDHHPEYGAAYLSRSHLLAKMGQDDEAVEDRKMVALLTQRNIEDFAITNNLWQTRQMAVEAEMETELNR